MVLLLMFAGEVAAAVYFFVQRAQIEADYTKYLKGIAQQFNFENRTVESSMLNGKQALVRFVSLRAHYVTLRYVTCVVMRDDTVHVLIILCTAGT
jgi:hypothetical protein